MSWGSVAKQVRLDKEKNPTHYCADHRCLFRTLNARTGEVKACPKHAMTFFPRRG